MKKSTATILVGLAVAIVVIVGIFLFLTNNSEESNPSSETASVLPAVNCLAGNNPLRVKLVDSDLYTLSNLPASTWYDNCPPNAGNLADFTLAAGQHTVHTTNIPGYTVTAGTCTSTIAISNCDMAGVGARTAILPITPKCDAITCGIQVNIEEGQYTKVIFEYVPNESIPTLTATTTAKFNLGEIAITNRDLNARSKPSRVRNTPLAVIPKDTTGTVLQGPVTAEGYNWYQVNYDIDAMGLSGWSADIGLDKSSDSFLELYINLYSLYSNNLSVTPEELRQAFIDIDSENAQTALRAASIINSVLSSLSYITGPVGAVIGVIVAVLQYVLAPDYSTGYWNNPIKGALYSAATAGVQTANLALDFLYSAGLDNIPTSFLVNQVAPITNSIMPYYATAQGGVGAIKASDTVNGGYGSKEEYTANFTRAQQRLLGLVQNLLRRGVTYERLGALPVSGRWAWQTMDLYNPIQDFYNRGASRYDPEAWQLLSTVGYQTPVTVWQSTGEGGIEVPTGAMQTWINGPEGPMPIPAGWLTPAILFQASKGSGEIEGARAESLITSMYGGAFWTAFARMGVGGQAMQNLIQQHFDPWVLTRTWGSEGIENALLPLVQVLIMEESQRNSGGSTGSGGGDGGSR